MVDYYKLLGVILLQRVFSNGKEIGLLIRMFRDTFKVRPTLHVGMMKKPLEPYSMNAHRSRLPSPTIFMPYKNSS